MTPHVPLIFGPPGQFCSSKVSSNGDTNDLDIDVPS